MSTVRATQWCRREGIRAQGSSPTPRGTKGCRRWPTFIREQERGIRLLQTISSSSIRDINRLVNLSYMILGYLIWGQDNKYNMYEDIELDECARYMDVYTI